MLSRRRRGDRGQVIITVAIAFSLFVLGCIALVGNLATIYGADALATSAAQDAAIAGSADIDLPAFLSGNPHGPIKLITGKGCPDDAKCVCEAVAGAELGSVGSATCTVNGQEITAKVTIDVPLPVPIVSGSVTVTRTYQAAAVAGTTTPIP